MKNKDLLILEKINKYCDEISFTIDRLGDSYETFSEDFVFQNACAMCILQIGELANKFSDEFLSVNADIPWRAIRNMRNLFAHNYGNADLEITWSTIKEDIPTLKVKCEKLIELNKSK